MNAKSPNGLSLKTRMALSTLAIFLISMWALAYYASTSLRRDLVRISGQQQFSTASLIAAQINDQLGERIQALKMVAGEITPSMLKKPASLQTLLNQRQLLMLLFNGGVFATGTDGIANADMPLDAGRIGVNYMDRASVSTPLRDGKTTVGSPAMGKKLGAPVFSISAPISDANGKILGVLVGTINLGLPNFIDTLAQGSYGQTGGYEIVSRDPRLVVTATDKGRIMQPIGRTDMSNRYISGYEGTDVFVNGIGVEVLASVKGIPVANWYLAASLPTSEAFTPIYETQRQMFLATLVISLLACAVVWLLLRRHLFPILSTVEELANMANETVPLAPLPVPQHIEVAELVTGVNRVLDTLKLRELALLEAGAFRSAIIDSVTAEIAVLDGQGVITAVNQPWNLFAAQNALISGATPPNTGIGTNYLRVCTAATGSADGDHALHATQGIQAVLNRSLPTFTMEYDCHSPDEQRWFMLVVTPLDRPSGGAVVAHNNITKRKLAEESTRQSEERLTRMQTGANDAFWDFDMVNKQMFYSLRWWSMLGYVGEQHSSDPDLWRRLLHPDDVRRITQAFDALDFNDLKAGVLEFRLLHQDGHYVSVECRGVILRDQDGKAIRISGANTDLTERKRAEALLLSAKAEAERANNAKSRFMAAASHDLRQPLYALTLYIGVLKGRASAQDGSLFKQIEGCCVSLTELLTDLLDVSKLDAGVVVVKLSDFAIEDVLKSLVAVHSAEADIKGLRLRLRPCPGINVRTDPILLARIVSNLIANAIRFASKGGILVACRQHAGRLWLEVWDTGIGIAADKTERVFEEFTKLDDAENHAGSGLGLAIVAKTAALLDLKIRVKSSLGKGSMFAIELPVSRASVTMTTVPCLPETRLLRIGLVDNDSEVLDALTLALEATGHEVIGAMTGSDLLRCLGQQAPDIVISDYRLAAEETGFDVVSAARAVFGKTLPALIISGDTDPALMRRMAEHAISIQYKPMRMDSLQRAMRQLTERWQE